MGTYNSSKTRIQPVFDQLLASDSRGATWLPALLALPRRFDGLQPAVPANLGIIVDHAWSPERKLAPPKSLLKWLVEHPPADHPANLGTRDAVKRDKRRLLFEGDPPTRGEALALLAAPTADTDWHVFEGPTSVDAYLETDHAIILIEGKRTESGPTTSTTWMAVRHQMLRNIDAAWDDRGDRAILGFFIVGADTAIDVPAAWKQFARVTVSREALAGSLPHRSEEEREAIAGSFLGVTTWGAVCAKFEIDYDKLPDKAVA